jgi:hypothetical protein
MQNEISTVGPEATPDRIMQVGLGFWGAKTLLSAIEIGLFTELAKGALAAEEIGRRLELHPRSRRDFLDALVALGFLKRDGQEYSNTPDSDFFLDRAKPSYAGGLLEMANERLYPFWGALTEGLKSGCPQNESKDGKNIFEALYDDPHRLKLFLSGMTGISMGAARAIAEKFPWQNHETFVDVGGAQGCLAVQLAQQHSHLSGANFDLAPVRPVFEEYVQSFGLSDRLRFIEGNFFEGDLPQAEVLVMGHILHDWNLKEKRELLRKAHAALPEGGALIVYEALIDNDRRENAFGLLMSLNMLIETAGGFDFTGADCSGWMCEAGFRETRVTHLCGPDSMVVGIK